MKADYNDMVMKANELSSQGREISKLIADAYLAVDELKPEKWGGKRYNTVISEFNKIVDSLNQLNEIIVFEIPNEICNAAYDYGANFEGASMPARSIESKNTVNIIANCDETLLDFKADIVNDTLSNVKTNFGTVEKMLDDYKLKVNALIWEGDAANSVKKTLENLITVILDQFTTIENVFETNLSLAIEKNEEIEQKRSM